MNPTSPWAEWFKGKYLPTSPLGKGLPFPLPHAWKLPPKSRQEGPTKPSQAQPSPVKGSQSHPKPAKDQPKPAKPSQSQPSPTKAQPKPGQDHPKILQNHITVIQNQGFVKSRAPVATQRNSTPTLVRGVCPPGKGETPPRALNPLRRAVLEPLITASLAILVASFFASLSYFVFD